MNQTSFFAGQVMIYDGSDTRQDMALQLDGTFPDTTLTSTTSNGLTVAVMTGKQGESDGFTFEYRAVSERGSYKVGAYQYQ